MNSAIRKIIASALALIMALCCSVYVLPTEAYAAPSITRASGAVDSLVVSDSAAATSIVRISGANRFDTAAQIAGVGFSSADTVVLASGRSYPDALAGVPLAYALNAPILLVEQQKIPDSTLRQIDSLGASEVYILGGTAAVGIDVERQLSRRGLTVHRLSGRNRYETAAAVGQELLMISGLPDSVYIVGAENYPDALSASPIAALKGAPVIYSNSRAVLDSRSAELIRTIDPNNVYIIGGNAAVGSSIGTSLRSCGVTSSERIYGSSRYETSLKANQRFSSLFTGDGAILVTGENYPDALVGGVYAANYRIPLQLTSSKQISTNSISTATPSNSYNSGLSFAENLVRFLAARSPSTLTVLGGTKALSDEAIESYIYGSGSSTPGSSNTGSFDYSELGSYASDFKWSLNGSTLTLSGTGRMPDWDVDNKEFTPWDSSCAKITKVVVKDGLTSIGNCAFMSCSNLTSVSIPSSVKSIGKQAFTFCGALRKLDLPSGLRNIGEWAFAYCTNLTDIRLPATLVKLDNYAFCECESLTEIVIPNGISAISLQAFYGCTQLENVVLGSGVREIQAWAFSYCSSLDGIIIPEGVHTIQERAFTGCMALSEIVLPDSLTRLGTRAFSESGIERAVIGRGVRELNETFIFCADLTSVTIHDGVTSIGDYAFYECCSLTSITIPDSVTSIDRSVFSGCSSLTSVTIPDSVTLIGDYAFYECYSLTSVTIPDSVTSIGEAAFGYCSSLTSITIPDSVTSIGDYAFCGCNSLTSVTIPDSVTSIGYNAFHECYITVYAPNEPSYYGYDPYSGVSEWIVTDDGTSDDNPYPPGVDYTPGLCELLVEVHYDGEPLSGHLVELYDYHTEELIAGAVTDDGGWCTMFVPCQEYMVEIWSPLSAGWVLDAQIPVEIPLCENALLNLDCSTF